MRRLLVGLLSLGLAVVGSQLAHAAAYRAAAPDADVRAQLLDETGHAYLQHLPLLLALVTVVVALALVFESRAARVGGAASRPRAWAFALVTPAVFCVQEHVERLFHDGSFPWDAWADRTFVLGLAIQLPFAAAAYLLARLLLRAAHVLGRLLADHGAPIPVRGAGWARAALAPPRATTGCLALGPRGPPLGQG